MTKKFLVYALVAAMPFMLWGCGNKSEEPSKDSAGTVVIDPNDNAAVAEQDTDDDNDQNTANMISIETPEMPEKGKYKVVNDDNIVFVIYNEGSCVITTSYIYSGGSLNKIEAAHKYENASLAKDAYNKLKENKTEYDSYAKVSLKDNVITFTLEQNEVDSLKSVSQEQLYNQQKNLEEK